MGLKLFSGWRKSAPAEPMELDLDPSPSLTPRASPRKNTYAVVTVVYESGYKRKGVIVNHSGQGAKVRFMSNEDMPSRVAVRMPNQAGDQWADVVWRDFCDAGLRFDR